MKITQIEFANYKVMHEFTLPLRAVNLLVGKNNSGKSTIMSVFGILGYTVRTVQAGTPIRVKNAEGKLTIGHHIPDTNLPTSIDNVHTDYTEVTPHSAKILWSTETK